MSRRTVDRGDAQFMVANELPTGFSLLHVLPGYDATISCLAWSPDGAALASGGRGGRIVVWNARTGRFHRNLDAGLGDVRALEWSPTGCLLASGSTKGRLGVWDARKGRLFKGLRVWYSRPLTAIAWSPDGQRIAFSTTDAVDIVNLKSLKIGISIRERPILSLAWSPDGRVIAGGSINRVLLWEAETGQPRGYLDGRFGQVGAVSWSRDCRVLVCACSDGTVRIWDVNTSRLERTLEGHSEQVGSLSLSDNGRFLVSSAKDREALNGLNYREREILKLRLGLGDGYTYTRNEVGRIFKVTAERIGQFERRALRKLLDIERSTKKSTKEVRVWKLDTGETVATFKSSAATLSPRSPVVFSPSAPVLATLSDLDSAIHLLHLDYSSLAGPRTNLKTIGYANAKVVLIGETSCGKTCLARALLHKPFQPQKSTHGMRVWPLRAERVKQPNGQYVTREAMLWDLAGQRDYQIVHQLFLDDTAVGVLVFDSGRSDNPLAGVKYWTRALKRIAGPHCKRLLVAGRADRGHPAISHEDIEAYLRTHSFTKFIVTSANTGLGISMLRSAIGAAIPWDALPVTTSPILWREIRAYLVNRRFGRDPLTTSASLEAAFRKKHPRLKFSRTDFDTVMAHAQAQGLLCKLSFGDLVLMKPELLNDYASAIVQEARKHPQGLGCVDEKEVIEGTIDFQDLARLEDPVVERSLLHSVIELFLDKEIAFREGEHLVFPSRFNRERPEYPARSSPDVAYKFSGPIEAVYATLVVGLFYCGAFELSSLWKDAAEFRTTSGATCGFTLQAESDEIGRIAVFFERNVPRDDRALFLQFVHDHLEKRALRGTLEQDRIYRCSNCGSEIKDREAVLARLRRNLHTITCQYCDFQVALAELPEGGPSGFHLTREVRQLEERARRQKGRAVKLTAAKAKKNIGCFDVFLAYNRKDEQAVESVAEELRQRGLNPWLDKEQIPPGRWFQEVIQKTIPVVKCAAIFIGRNGIGKWQVLELRAFVSECVESNLPVIPVLLPGVKDVPSVCRFLKELQYVKFDKSVSEIEPLDRLEWGIVAD